LCGIGTERADGRDRKSCTSVERASDTCGADGRGRRRVGSGVPDDASTDPAAPSPKPPQAAGPTGVPQPGNPAMVATRMSLPPTRSSITHKFTVGGFEGYLTVGLHPTGEPGEIFIKMSKEGSTLSGMCQAFCRAFSLSLQYGLPLREACDRFKGMRFEPMGFTNNPEIPEAMSIVDYVARYLELNFAGGGRVR
jgi:ribonucleoside-diphosphate reductase alpha chain